MARRYTRTPFDVAKKPPRTTKARTSKPLDRVGILADAFADCAEHVHAVRDGREDGSKGPTHRERAEAALRAMGRTQPPVADPGAPRCRATETDPATGHLDRCVLDAGHGGQHATGDGSHRWGVADPGAVSEGDVPDTVCETCAGACAACRHVARGWGGRALSLVRAEARPVDLSALREAVYAIPIDELRPLLPFGGNEGTERLYVLGVVERLLRALVDATPAEPVAADSCRRYHKHFLACECLGSAPQEPAEPVRACTCGRYPRAKWGVGDDGLARVVGTEPCVHCNRKATSDEEGGHG